MREVTRFLGPNDVPGTLVFVMDDEKTAPIKVMLSMDTKQGTLDQIKKDYNSANYHYTDDQIVDDITIWKKLLALVGKSSEELKNISLDGGGRKSKKRKSKKRKSKKRKSKKRRTRRR